LKGENQGTLDFKVCIRFDWNNASVKLSSKMPPLKIICPPFEDHDDNKPFDVLYLKGRYSYEAVTADLHHWWRGMGTPTFGGAQGISP
jgi:hypothetical protein